MKMDASAKRFFLMDQMAQELAKADARKAHKVTYSATLIMLAAFMGVFAGHETWNDIALYASLHRTLDVELNEDDDRKRGISALNF